MPVTIFPSSVYMYICANIQSGERKNTLLHRRKASSNDMGKNMLNVNLAGNFYCNTMYM